MTPSKPASSAARATCTYSSNGENRPGRSSRTEESNTGRGATRVGIVQTNSAIVAGSFGSDQLACRQDRAAVDPRLQVEVRGEEPVHQQELLLPGEELDALVGEVGVQREVEVVAVCLLDAFGAGPGLFLQDLADIVEVLGRPIGGTQRLGEELDDEIGP